MVRDLMDKLFLKTLLIALALVAGRAHADAIIWSRAMFASTIAEFYVEDDGVTLELEIGLSDLKGFANLQPDEIYERLGNEPKPWAERLALFFTEDLVIADAEGTPLPGRILEMGPEARVQRDPITGEALPVPEDEEPEYTINARLHYPFNQRPQTLTFMLGPRMAGVSVGFVVYHEGVSVNDFRYLSASQTLTLDWEDPWYSVFTARPLRRQYFTAMNGFIYVEPYEVRKEIIVRPKDLEYWIDLGLEGRETIPIEMQPELLQKVAAFLAEHHPMTIDGEPVEPELARINFLERSLRTSRVIDPPEELGVNVAMIGAIFVYPTDGIPQKVTMEWDLFNERIQRVAASAVDPLGPLPSYLEPDYNILEWENFIKINVMPTMATILPPPSAFELALRWLRWVLLAGALFAIWRAVSTRKQAGVALAALSIVVAAGSFWLARGAGLNDEKAHDVVGGLLHNIYRAFDFRDEEQIYDVLDRSVTGDLLTDIYLETRRGLELVSQGGARVKVKDIELLELTAEPADDGGFDATATWNVAGSVGHWGHIHQRINQYQAKLNILPIDGEWKLTGLDILLEERLPTGPLAPGQTPTAQQPDPNAKPE